MINGKFISVGHPLDLESSQIALQGEALQRELAKIDSSGWHADSKIGSTSWLRLSMFCAQFREEILTLSLGSGPQPNLREQA